MSDKKESKSLRFAYYAVPILLVVYVLSIGPFFAVVGYSGNNPRATIDYGMASNTYESFYAPVLWVERKNQPICRLLSKYKSYCFGTMYPDWYPIPNGPHSLEYENNSF